MLVDGVRTGDDLLQLIQIASEINPSRVEDIIKTMFKAGLGCLWKEVSIDGVEGFNKLASLLEAKGYQLEDKEKTFLASIAEEIAEPLKDVRENLSLEELSLARIQTLCENICNQLIAEIYGFIYRMEQSEERASLLDQREIITKFEVFYYAGNAADTANLETVFLQASRYLQKILDPIIFKRPKKFCDLSDSGRTLIQVLVIELRQAES